MVGVQLLPDVKVNVERDLNGNRAHTHAHGISSILTRGSKQVCIEAKEEFKQRLAQNLVGCEVYKQKFPVWRVVC